MSNVYINLFFPRIALFPLPPFFIMAEIKTRGHYQELSATTALFAKALRGFCTGVNNCKTQYFQHFCIYFPKELMGSIILLNPLSSPSLGAPENFLAFHNMGRIFKIYDSCERNLMIKMLEMYVI